MPVNEIGAAGYIKIFYTNNDTAHQHEARVYFQYEVTDAGDGTLILDGSTNPDTSDNWTVHDVVKEIFDRAATIAGGSPAYTVDRVEGYVPATGTDTFMGIDAADYTDVTGGSASTVGAAYLCLTFHDQFRHKLSFFLKDWHTATPTDFHPAVPLVDNNTLEWFFIRGSAGISTNDGNDLKNLSSWRTGYDGGLADTYGRAFNS